MAHLGTIVFFPRGMCKYVYVCVRVCVFVRLVSDASNGSKVDSTTTVGVSAEKDDLEVQIMAVVLGVWLVAQYFGT